MLRSARRIGFGLSPPWQLRRTNYARPSLAPCVSMSSTATADQETKTEQDLRPGVLDRTNGFAEGASVNFWRHFNSTSPGTLEQLLRDLSADTVQSRNALPYYAYCLGRSLYFSGQGLVGLLAHIRKSENASFSSVPSRLNAQAQLVEAGNVFRDDWRRIASGVYRAPWDAMPKHRQNNPINMVRSFVRFVRNARETLGKRENADSTDTSVWLDSAVFPDYYRNTFHFQRDGWQSKASADVYEISSETLFLGRQDAMQRLALAGIREAVGDAQQPTIVELGAGTGRLATFVLDNWPRGKYVVNDLSPFYLAKARENVSYWEKFRGEMADVRYVHAAAENTRLEEGSADVVMSVYLFHEMPPEARRAVVKEAVRVLKPGGMFVFVDSIQLGDREANDERLDRFEKFNEPYYPSYVRDDIGAIFKENGLVPVTKEICSVTKLLTARKEEL